MTGRGDEGGGDGKIEWRNTVRSSYLRRRESKGRMAAERRREGGGRQVERAEQIKGRESEDVVADESVQIKGSISAWRGVVLRGSRHRRL